MPPRRLNARVRGVMGFSWLAAAEEEEEDWVLLLLAISLRDMAGSFCSNSRVEGESRWA